MTNQELEQKLNALVSQERRITKEILELINLAEERRLYLERGFPSLFEWLVKTYGYSQPAAYRRIQAARLLRAVPQISEKIETGQVNLTNLAKAQSAIRMVKKKSGQVTAETKSELVRAIASKTSAETDQTILSLFPELSSEIHREQVKAVSPDAARLSVNLPNETIADLDRIRDLISHSKPDANYAEIIQFVARQFLEKRDPLRESTKSAAVQRCVRPSQIPAQLRRNKIRSAGSRCEWTDPSTGQRCGSSYQLEIDHIKPRAIGGTDEADNLRCLCRNHNQMMAKRNLGEKTAGKWKFTRSDGR
jgi:hypothetical protein